MLSSFFDITDVVTGKEEIVLSIFVEKKFIVYLPKKRISWKRTFFYINL